MLPFDVSVFIVEGNVDIAAVVAVVAVAVVVVVAPAEGYVILALLLQMVFASGRYLQALLS